MQWATAPTTCCSARARWTWSTRSAKASGTIRSSRPRSASIRGYLEQYTKSAPHAQIYFTPQPLFFNVTTDWAAALQRMVAGEVQVSEGLDQLAANIDTQMKQSGLG